MKNLVPVTFVWHQGAGLGQMQSRDGAGRGGKSVGLQVWEGLSVPCDTCHCKDGKAEAELKIAELRCRTRGTEPDF